MSHQLIVGRTEAPGEYVVKRSLPVFCGLDALYSTPRAVPAPACPGLSGPAVHSRQNRGYGFRFMAAFNRARPAQSFRMLARYPG